MRGLIARLVGAGTEQRSSELLLRLALAASALVGVSGMALGAPLVQIAIGTEYAPAGRLLGPALWLLLPFSVGHLLNQLLYAHGDYAAVARCALSGAVAMALVLPLLATDWGAGLGPAGALVATGLGVLVWTLMLLVTVLRQGRLNLSAPLVRTLGAAALSPLIYLGVAQAEAWVGIAPPVAAAVALGAGLIVLFLGIVPAEGRALAALLGLGRDRR